MGILTSDSSADKLDAPVCKCSTQKFCLEYFGMSYFLYFILFLGNGIMKSSLFIFKIEVGLSVKGMKVINRNPGMFVGDKLCSCRARHPQYLPRCDFMFRSG